MKRALVAVALLTAGFAGAQVAPTAEIEQLYLDPAARGSLLVGNGQTMRGGTFRVSAAMQYSHGHVKTGSSTLLRDRFALHVLGAVGVTHWLELSGDVPVVLHQISDGGAFNPSPSGLSTPFIHAKIGILGTGSAVALWTSVGLGLPVGTAGALGNGGLVFAPRLNLGRAFERVQLGLELGALVRGLGSFSDVSGVSPSSIARADRVGSQLYASIAASQIGDGLRGEFSLRAYASLAGTSPGLEVLFGARYPYKDVEFFVAGGPGIGGSPTTPTYRLFGGVAFGNGGPPLPRCTESIAYPIDECPLLDADGDGVMNGVDVQPRAAEDKDGFQDEDGAPEPDNDADTVLDVNDKCPNVAGPVSNGGCPEAAPAEPHPVEPEPAEPKDPE